ncbi:hypothetical protein [Clostridium sp.]|uniref:hypothetical protein n=1 Tax=Clostridium sp. TaxID=1506 RepID=UPI0032174C35
MKIGNYMVDMTSSHSYTEVKTSNERLKYWNRNNVTEIEGNGDIANLENLAKEKKDSSEVASKESKTTKSSIGGFFKSVAANIKDSATSLIDTGSKTVVSIGEDVKGAVEKIGTSVDEIKSEWSNSNNGIVDKVVKTGDMVKDGVEFVKEPIKGIENTALTGYNEINGTIQNAYGATIF